MGSITDAMETDWIQHLVGEASYTHTDTYIALSTGTISDDGTGLSEPGDTYARQQVVDANWDTAASRKTANSGTISFPQASGSWGTITDWAIMTASSGGTMLAYGTLDVSKAVVAGNTPSFAAGEIEVSVNASAAAGGFFDDHVHKMLDLIFKNVAYSSPTHYLALSTTTPTDSGPNFTEPGGNGYAREQITSWNTVASGATDNNGAITMDTPTGSWGLITHLGTYDNSSGGNPIMWGDVTDQTPTTDDTVTVPDGDLDVSIT